MSLFRRSTSDLPKLDFSGVVSFYTNDSHVSAGDDEVILSLGVRPRPAGVSETPVPLQRVYLSFYTAKRMLLALEMAIRRHEQTFGEVTGRVPTDTVSTSPAVARAVYVNFIRATGTAEELIIDCGVNSAPWQAQGMSPGPILIHSQAALSFSTARNLCQQISQVLQSYEARHGTLDLNVAKRLL